MRGTLKIRNSDNEPIVRPHIQELIEKQLGRSILEFNDCVVLSAAIKKKSRHNLPPTLLSQLFGFEELVMKPDQKTLDAIANYLNRKSWNDLPPADHRERDNLVLDIAHDETYRTIIRNRMRQFLIGFGLVVIVILAFVFSGK